MGTKRFVLLQGGAWDVGDLLKKSEMWHWDVIVCHALRCSTHKKGRDNAHGKISQVKDK